MKVIFGKRIWLPNKLLPEFKPKQQFDVYKNPKMCERCELESDKPMQCGGCPQFGGSFNLIKPHPTKPMFGIPYGEKRAILKMAEKNGFEIVDRIPFKPFTFPIKWTGKLYTEKDTQTKKNIADQVALVKEWYDKGCCGVLQARPRTGKSVMALRLVVKIGQKTLILGRQEEILKQFRKAILGSDTHKSVTNIPDIATEKRPIVKLVKSIRDIKKYKPDIALATYQSFIRDVDRAKTDFLNEYFNFLVVDECHNAGAEAYTTLISKLQMPYRLGLTATVKRKDGMDVLVRKFIGPVLAFSSSIALTPTLKPYMVQAKPPTDYQSWHGLQAWLANSKERNKEIVKQVFKDLRDGHKTIILPVDRVRHIKDLAKMINKQAEFNRERRSEKWPIKLAVEFHRKTPREEVLKRVDNGKPCVLVSNRGMIREGIDMQTPSMLYMLIPMSANSYAGAPMFEQLANRVCTPFEGKPPPVVRLWFDQTTIANRCANSLYWHCIKPNNLKFNRKGFWNVDPMMDMSIRKPLSARRVSTKRITEW